MVYLVPTQKSSYVEIALITKILRWASVSQSEFIDASEKIYKNIYIELKPKHSSIIYPSQTSTSDAPW